MPIRSAATTIHGSSAYQVQPVTKVGSWHAAHDGIVAARIVYSRPMKRVLLALISAYRLLLSPLLGASCRFYPTCSTYAAEAIETHGALRGTWLAVKRILKCHPWHPGGVDPVPPAKSGDGR